MTQAPIWSVPLSGPVSPDVMAQRIDNSLDAQLSSHSGASRPAYAVAGTLWLSTATAGKHKYYFYDGAADRLMLTIDTATGAIQYSDGVSTDVLSTLLAKAGGAMTGPIENAVFAASGANTKRAHFDLTAVSAGQDRAIIVPDFNNLALNKWELIRDTPLSAAASMDVTGLSAYRRLWIHGHVYPSTTAGVFIRTSTNNGSSYDSGVSDYAYQNLNALASTVATVATSGTTAFSIGGTTGILSGIDNGIQFDLFIDNFNKAAQCKFECHANAVTAGDLVNQSSGRRAQSTARNALTIFPGSGTMTGFATIEGIRG